MLLLLLLSTLSLTGGKPRCGGTLTASKGTLQTPNYPQKFPIPIHCEWVIDSQNVANSNTSIVVYFTQLFVYEGLSFTEYQVYDRTYQLDGRTIHTVNESNVVQVKWVQSFQNFLVVTLKLDSNEGVHLRVLDQFLDVYGFNISYEITNRGVRRDSCTMADCGFTGLCHDYYTKFSCDCFSGYEGPHCSNGPKSLCEQDNVCKNKATCLHVGVSTVKCQCTKEFIGDTCQTPSIKTRICENCLMSCPFDGKLENVCSCSKNELNDRVKFMGTLHLSNFPNLRGKLLKEFVEQQIMKALKMNHSKIENVSVENIIHFGSGADVIFHLYGQKKDEKRVKAIFTRWVDRGFIANLTVPDKEFVFRPLLDLQSISINQNGIIRENDEFLLSCMARGPSTISFRWLKDGVPINTTTNRKWSRLIKDPHIEDQYTALLGVEQAHTLDSGIFTCQVESSNMQQCLSRRVVVKAPPLIEIQPMSLTVKKGENFTIKCLSKGDNKLSYSWTKNKELIPVRSDNEVYKILYPGGSLLQVFNIEKSVKYSCLVQDDSISNEISVNVHVIDPNLIRTCPEQQYLNVEWSETAPDTDSIQQCPKGFTFPGFVRRSCILKDGHRPIWQQSDYSHCSSLYISTLYNDFQMLRLGYETKSIIEILSKCLFYFTSGKFELLPGEGAGILVFLQEIISYKPQFEDDSLLNSSRTVFQIIDRILLAKWSLVNQEQVEVLQEVVNSQVQQLSLIEIKSIFNLSLKMLHVIKITDNTISFPLNENWDKWQLSRIHVKLKQVTRPILAAILYKNLTSFLPNRSVLRLRDGAEVEYEVLSQIVYLWILSSKSNINDAYVTLDWAHESGANSNQESWNIKCATTSNPTISHTWNTSICITEKLNDTNTRCLCPGNVGTYAVLQTNNYIQVEREEPRPRRYVVLAGCSICLLMTSICSITLIAQLIVKKSCITFLKLQCCLSVAGVMAIFILASIGQPPEEMYGNVMGLIEILILMAMSSHLSTLLVIYTELLEFSKTTASKQTVIGITSGVPVITVFGNHLAHRTMDIKLQSWWLLIGTLGFYIFLTVTIVICALFLLLYFTVIGKLKKLCYIHEKDIKSLQKRVMLLKRTACVFFFLIITIGSSVLYINFLDSIWFNYEFCISTMFLALTLTLCYILKPEQDYIFNRKPKPKDPFYIEATTRPINFFSNKEESKSNNERGMSKKECCSDSVLPGLPECVSGTMESFCSDAIYCERNQENLEMYNKSPQPYRKTTTFRLDADCSPDIITSKMCTQLDIVASHAPSIIVTDEASAVVLESPLRTQPDSREPEENLDGMLNRISHDLDYLLNRNEDAVLVRKIVKTPLPGVIPEEEEEDSGDILRTSC